MKDVIAIFLRIKCGTTLSASIECTFKFGTKSQNACRLVQEQHSKVHFFVVNVLMIKIILTMTTTKTMIILIIAIIITDHLYGAKIHESNLYNHLKFTNLKDINLAENSLLNYSADHASAIYDKGFSLGNLSNLVVGCPK